MRGFYKILLILIFAFYFIAPLYAKGTYYVGEDDGGVYFQTDKNGGWYINQEDLKYFSIGESGSYRIYKDRNGTFITIDKGYKFYLDTDADQQLEKKIQAFNETQEQKTEKLKEKELKRKELELQKKALEKSEETAAKENRQIEITVTMVYGTPYSSRIGPIYHPHHRPPKHPKMKSGSVRWLKHPKRNPEIIESPFHRYP
jgi:hypothetical protein